MADEEELPDDGYALLRLDPEYDGSCPCATIALPSGVYELHCWRVCTDCAGCGLHYEGDEATALAMKGVLDAMDWYGEWALVRGRRRAVVEVTS